MSVFVAAFFATQGVADNETETQYALRSCEAFHALFPDSTVPFVKFNTLNGVLPFSCISNCSSASPQKRTTMNRVVKVEDEDEAVEEEDDEDKDEVVIRRPSPEK